MTRLRPLPALRAALLTTILVAPVSAAAQTTFPGDVIVQGSLCAGLDCPPASFGFDTLVLRENNLRIFFDDTSVSAGFPANKWRITINDSASGGANFFSVDDATANRSVFKVTAGAPANSLFVASSGNVGLGTAAPALDLSISTSDTPAIRLEQTAAGGFTAQTWDVAGNEANFFVRDVTGGSRLPFRIRPGAPTSSIDIAANGNVGVGVIPLSIAKMQVHAGTDQNLLVRGFGTLSDGVTIDSVDDANTQNKSLEIRASAVAISAIPNCASGIKSGANGLLSCVVSSRQFKNVTGDLSTKVALTNVMALRPQTGSYKETPDVPEHWLIAEDVAAIDPALAGLNDGKPYVVKTQNIVADLVAVVQQQQRRIDELERRLTAR